MSRELKRLLQLLERLLSLAMIIVAARALPSWPALALLLLSFWAFRRSVFREAASRVAEALAEGQRAVPPLGLRDVALDMGAVVAVALGAAAVPAAWAFPPLTVGALVLAHNAPLRAAARLLDSLERRRRGPADQQRRGEEDGED